MMNRMNTGLVPNGTLDGPMGCNVWRSSNGRFTLPNFTSFRDFNTSLHDSVPILTGQKGRKNMLALVSSQPYDAFSSSVTLTLPTPIKTAKLYLLTANLAKSLKCYTPHAELTFTYATGKTDLVQLTPPWTFAGIGANPGYEAYSPAAYAFPFGHLTGVLGSATPKLTVQDVLVPSPELELSSIQLKVTTTETIFGIMGAALLRTAKPLKTTDNDAAHRSSGGLDRVPVFTFGEQGYPVFREPAIILLPQTGHLLAFIEGGQNHVNGDSDESYPNSNSDVVSKTSTDGGATCELDPTLSSIRPGFLMPAMSMQMVV